MGFIGGFTKKPTGFFGYVPRCLNPGVQVPDRSGFENAALRRAHKWKFHVKVQYDIQSSCAYADVMSFVNFAQAYFMG